MELLLTLFYFFLLSLLLFRMPFFSLSVIPKKIVWGAFAIKVFTGFLLSLIYTYYYTSRADADIYKYFDDSQILYDLFWTHPKHFFQIIFDINTQSEVFASYFHKMNYWYNKFNVYNDNRTMIKLNALIRFISMGYFQVHNLVLSFLSFTGLVALYKVFTDVLKRHFILLFLIVFLTPSVLFWSSSVLKDSLLVFSIGFLLYYFYQILKEPTIKKLIPLLVFIGFLSLIKPYILMIMLPGLLAWAVTAKIFRTYPGFVFTVSYSLFIIVLFNIELFLPQYNFKEILQEKQENFINLTKEQVIGSYIYIQPFSAEGWSILKAVPRAFTNIFFRPHLFDSRSPFILLAAFENLLIWLAGVFCLLFFKKQKAHPLIYFSLFFTILLFVLTGLVTPIMGAYVRYKMPALPFLLFIFIYFTDWERLYEKLPLLKRLHFFKLGQ